MDTPFKVTWNSGTITIHASSEREACSHALEYILAKAIRAESDAKDVIPLPPEES